jgi:hypothetical protein
MVNAATLKVGDQVGVGSYGNYGLSNPRVTTVTKVNGHGHVTVDGGDVFDKHGNSRKQYSRDTLIPIERVLEHQAAQTRNAKIRLHVNELKTALEAQTNRYTGNFCASAAELDIMQAAIDELRKFV